jgi:hypothetical protein
VADEVKEKDPDAKLDYGVNWAGGWLGDDTIASSAWQADAGITIMTTPAPSHTTTTTTVWLEGGTAGQSYQVTNHVVTAAGREDDRSLWIRVRER